MFVGTSDMVISDELEKLRIRIKNNIINQGLSASGRTANEMHVEMEQGVGRLYGRAYFGTMETGRKAGAAPKGFYEVIKQWAIDKRFVFETVRDRNTFAYFVARKIVAQGTKLHREGGRNDIYSKEIPAAVEAIKNRVSSVFVEDVVINNDNTIHLNL